MWQIRTYTCGSWNLLQHNLLYACRPESSMFIDCLLLWPHPPRGSYAVGSPLFALAFSLMELSPNRNQGCPKSSSICNIVHLWLLLMFYCCCYGWYVTNTVCFPGYTTPTRCVCNEMYLAWSDFEPKFEARKLLNQTRNPTARKPALKLEKKLATRCATSKCYPKVLPEMLRKNIRSIEKQDLWDTWCCFEWL